MLVNNSTLNKHLKHLTTGVYECDLLMKHQLERLGVKASDRISEDWLSGYGVCDNYQQVCERYPHIVSDLNRKYVILLTWHARDQQPEYGGWRWHKWGEYIGDHIKTAEYLHDELEIDGVYTFTIFQLLDN